MNGKKLIYVVAAASLLLTTLPLTAQPAMAQTNVVNVYSARHYGALEKVFTEFTKQSGITVRLSTGTSQALLERLRADGIATPADAFLVIDAGTAQIAAEENLLSAVDSETLNQAIPAEFRDPKGRWFGVTKRVRTIMYNPAKVKPEELSTYAALADRKWRGRLCLRPATHIYTVGLVSNLIANNGEKEAERIVRGWVANRPTFIDSDTRILETIAAGKCDVGITNHYYLANLLKKNPDFPVKALWANQKEAGVQVNITAIGVTANASNRDNAIKLIEWLATRGQAIDDTGIVGGNNEFPISPAAPKTKIVDGFGTFKIDSGALLKYGATQSQTLKLLERVGYK
jgi:iron(III) transport system substrate-binding protein